MPSKERLHGQLGPEVQQAFQLARKLTGREPILRREPALPGDTRAMLVRPKFPHRPYEIRYARGQERYLPHLIAHEVGHLVRLYRVPEAERLMPALTRESRRRAAEELAPDLVEMMRLGMTEHTLPELFDIWLQGVGTQLANFPADLRIEAWIHERFPGLRPIQERSLVEEVHRAYPSLQPQVARLTPPRVYWPTMAMNAAQAYQVARLYNRLELMAPFEQRGFADVGGYLAHLALGPHDQGHRSDMAAVNTWANELRLAGWFEWAPYLGSR